MEEEMNPEHTKGTRAVRILFSKVFYLRPDQSAKDCAKSFLSTMGFEYVSHEPVTPELPMNTAGEPARITCTRAGCLHVPVRGQDPDVRKSLRRLRRALRDRKDNPERT